MTPDPPKKVKIAILTPWAILNSPKHATVAISEKSGENCGKCTQMYNTRIYLDISLQFSDIKMKTKVSLFCKKNAVKTLVSDKPTLIGASKKAKKSKISPLISEGGLLTAHL